MKSKKKAPKKTSRVKVVGEGRFVQRTRKPKAQGKKIKSVLTRIDAEFAAYCREKALTKGSITEVTRDIYHFIKDKEIPSLTPPTVEIAS